MQIDHLNISVGFYGNFTAGDRLVRCYSLTDGGRQLDAQALSGQAMDIVGRRSAGSLKVLAGTALHMQNVSIGIDQDRCGGELVEDRLLGHAGHVGRSGGRADRFGPEIGSGGRPPAGEMNKLAQDPRYFSTFIYFPFFVPGAKQLGESTNRLGGTQHQNPAG